MSNARGLHVSSILERPGHRDFVRKFEVAANWNAHRDPRDTRAQRFQKRDR